MKKEEELTNLYYQTVFGYYPFVRDNNRLITQATIQYLLECNIDECILFNNIIKIKDGVIGPFNLPEIFWKDSLLKRDTFYTSRNLQIISPGPIIKDGKVLVNTNIWYLEMKIRFTIDDLYNYYLNNLKNNIIYTDKKKDVGALTYLLKSYSTIEDIESIDIILSTIDYIKNKNIPIRLTSVFDINNTTNTILNNIISKSSLAKKMQLHQIFWRTRLISHDKLTIKKDIVPTYDY